MSRLQNEPSWLNTLDMRRPPKTRDQTLWDWRREAPIRPVVFSDPGSLDATVQLHRWLDARQDARSAGHLAERRDRQGAVGGSAARLGRGAAQDLAQLKSHLQAQSNERQTRAIDELRRRGEQEAADMHTILGSQRTRIQQTAAAREKDMEQPGLFDKDGLKQLEADKRALSTLARTFRRDAGWHRRA